jgi:hypothetical protein
MNEAVRSRSTKIGGVLTAARENLERFTNELAGASNIDDKVVAMLGELSLLVTRLETRDREIKEQQKTIE